MMILSGAILVVALEIDEWTQPELYRSTPSERLLTRQRSTSSRPWRLPAGRTE